MPQKEETDPLLYYTTIYTESNIEEKNKKEETIIIPQEEESIPIISTTPKNPKTPKKCLKITLIILFILILLLISLSLITYYFIIPSQIKQTKLKITNLYIKNISQNDFYCDITTENAPPIELSNLNLRVYTTNELYIGDLFIPLLSSQSTSVFSVRKEFDEFDVLNLSKFKWKLKSENVELSILGVNLSGILFENEVEVEDGFDGLQKVEVFDLVVLGENNQNSFHFTNFYSDLPGIVIKCNFSIYNPSIISIDLINVYFGLFYKENQIGFIRVQNYTLKSKEINFILEDGLLLKSYDDDFLDLFVNHQEVSIKISGYQQSTNSWLERSLLKLNTTIKYTNKKYEISLDSLKMNKVVFKIHKEFSPDLECNVTALISHPFSFGIKVIETKQDIMFDNFGFINSTFSDCSSVKENGLIEVDTPVLGTLKIKNKNSYKNFISTLVRDKTVKFKVNGKITAKIETIIGTSEISLLINEELEITGMDLDYYNSLQTNLIVSVRENMNVFSVDYGGDFDFSLGAFMRSIGVQEEETIDNKETSDVFNNQVGLEFYGGQKRLFEFELLYYPSYEECEYYCKIGNFDQHCYCRHRYLDNSTFNPYYEPEVVGIMTLNSLNLNCGKKYCPIYPKGKFTFSYNEEFSEYCYDRHLCIGRSFLSSYLSGFGSIDGFSKKGVKIGMRLVNSLGDFEGVGFELKNVFVPGYSYYGEKKYDEIKGKENKENNKDNLVESANRINSLTTPPTTTKQSFAREPYQLVRRIIIMPGTGMLVGKLNCWLDFYNPFDVNLRYYYIHVDTFLDGKRIGVLWVNFTDYDAFMFRFKDNGDVEDDNLKEKVRFEENVDSFTHDSSLYAPSSRDDKHPSRYCVGQSDCQIRPVDIRPSSVIKQLNQSAGEVVWKKQNELAVDLDPGIHRTNRLEVGFQITNSAIKKFWELILHDDVRFNVSIKGQVAVGMGTVPYNGSASNVEKCEHRDYPNGYITNKRDRDSFCYPDLPAYEDVSLAWMDFGQVDTELVIVKSGKVTA